MSITEQDLAEKLAAARARAGSQTSSPTSSITETAEPGRLVSACPCGRGERSGFRWPGVGGRVQWAVCEACQEDARIREAEEQAAKREAEKRAAIEARVQNVGANLERKGVTRKYAGVTLDGFLPEHDAHAVKAARDLVRAFLAGERPSLFLYSERPGEAIAPGCGKTHLAVGVLRALALNPAVPLEQIGFAFVPRMLMEIQATFKHPEKSELSVVRKYATPEVLVWDDFGAEKLSDYSARTLYTLLYEREGKSNVFTSNHALGEIEARDPSGYMQRITSRIAGEAKIVRMTGPDRRLRAA